MLAEQRAYHEKRLIASVEIKVLCRFMQRSVQSPGADLKQQMGSFGLGVTVHCMLMLCRT